MTEEDYKNVGLKLLPQGLAWTKSVTSGFSKIFSGLGTMFADVDADAAQALQETNPRWSTLMLDEWENLLGLPECGESHQALSDRQKIAGEKWHLKGSLNKYFYQEWIKNAYGYDIEIVVRYPHHCLRPCNYPIYSHEYKSHVDVYIRIDSENPYRYLNVLDRANDPLIIGSPTVVECILKKYKPAHIEFVFHYEEKEK